MWVVFRRLTRATVYCAPPFYKDMVLLCFLRENGARAGPFPGVGGRVTKDVAGEAGGSKLVAGRRAALASGERCVVVEEVGRDAVRHSEAS